MTYQEERALKDATKAKKARKYIYERGGPRVMAQYPETKLDRAVGSAIARENAAVIEEERTGQPVSTRESRYWDFLADIINGADEDVRANPDRYPEITKRLAERKAEAELPMDLVSVLERRVERLQQEYLVDPENRRGRMTRCAELQRTITLIKASINEGEITINVLPEDEEAMS
jgi:hypothetical protein